MEAGIRFTDLAGDNDYYMEQKVLQEAKRMKQYATYFTEVKTRTEQYAKHLNAAFAPIKQTEEISGSLDTFHFALKAMINTFEEIIKTMYHYCLSLSNEVIEPIEIFTEHFESSNKIFLKESKQILDNVAERKSQLASLQEKYSRAIQSMLNLPLESLNAKKMNTLTTMRDKYLKSLNNHNEYSQKHKADYLKILDSLQQNEENRIDFARKIFSKFVSQTSSLLTSILSLTPNIIPPMTAVNPGGDIQIFLSEVQMKRGEALETMPMIEDDTIAQELIEVIKKELEKRAVEKLLAKEETGKEDEMHFAMIDRETGETEKDAGGKQLDKIDEEIILESIAGLLKRQQVSEGSPPVADFVLEKTHKLRLIELMQIPRARKLFVQAIYEHPAVADEDEYKGGYSISPVSLSCLGELINSYLINVSLFGDFDPSQLCKILAAGFRLFSLDISESSPKSAGKGKQTYLREYISDNSIWKHKELWRDIIEYNIKKAIYKVQCLKNLQVSKAKTSTGAPKKAPKEISDMQLKAIIYGCLSNCAFEMGLLSVSLSHGKELLAAFSAKNSLPPEKLFQLLNDFVCFQSLPRDCDPSESELLTISLQKREKERKEFGYSKEILMLGMAIKYQGDFKGLRNYLLINSKFNEVFKTHIYKIVLSRIPSNCPKKEAIRKDIWRLILDDKKIRQEYEEIKQKKVSEFVAARKGINDTINLDVIRSFHVFPEKYRESISSILRCYAIYNKEVEYCQGMNFIAGLFYLVFRDEASAFTMMANLIGNLNLTYLYKQDVPMLKCYFYQMNRLVAIYLPELHDHFKQEGINATYYASSWLLTAFTYTLQHCKSPYVPSLVYSIFDSFLIDGYKAIFKASLFILSHFELKLRSLHYERLIQFIGEIGKTDFFNSAEVESQYRKKIRDFNLTTELLDILNREYTELCKISQEGKAEDDEKHGNIVKHFVRTNGKFAAVYLPK